MVTRQEADHALSAGSGRQESPNADDNSATAAAAAAILAAAAVRSAAVSAAVAANFSAAAQCKGSNIATSLRCSVSTSRAASRNVSVSACQTVNVQLAKCTYSLNILYTSVPTTCPPYSCSHHILRSTCTPHPMSTGCCGLVASVTFSSSCRILSFKAPVKVSIHYDEQNQCEMYCSCSSPDCTLAGSNTSQPVPHSTLC